MCWSENKPDIEQTVDQNFVLNIGPDEPVLPCL